MISKRRPWKLFISKDFWRIADKNYRFVLEKAILEKHKIFWKAFKVIALNLFLDMYPVLPRMLLARCVEAFVEDLFMSFRFVSKQIKTSNAVGMFSLIFWLQAKEPRFSVCFNTVRNFNRSLNKRRLSPAQKIERLSLTFTANGRRQK